MAVTLKVTNIVRNSGGVELTFDWDTNSYTYGYATEAEAIAAGQETAATVPDVAKILMGFWLSRDETIQNDADILNKTISIETDARSGLLAVAKPVPTLCWTRSLLT